MEYPDWLLKALVQFNHRTTCVNEWELMDVKAIDLHRQADLPQRLDVLFESLQDGFGKDILVTGSFLAFGYDTEAGTWVFPRFVQFGKSAPALLEWRDDDADAAVRAFERARRELPADATPLIVQLPYFVRKVERYVPNGDITLEEFRKKFDRNEVIFTDVVRVTSEADVRRWLATHRSSHYEQRFVFTLAFNVVNGISDKLTEPRIKEALGYFMGAFLSWAGMGVADSTRYIMAAAAARLAHYSHEFLKPFGELRQYLQTHQDSVPPPLAERLKPVLDNVKLLELSNIAVGFNVEYYAFDKLLATALSRNTTFAVGEALRDGSYSLKLTIADVAERQMELAIEGLPDESLAIRFDPSFFDRLMRNLLRNAAQHSKAADHVVQVRLTFTEDREYGLLIMRFKHIGATIKRQVARLLFRMPISQADASSYGAGQSGAGGSKGIGLWTVGMGFEAQRLSLPQVVLDSEGVSFCFCFPTEKRK